MNSPNVLVVDDNPEIRALLRLWLERRGFRIHCASTAKRAFVWCESRRFQLVITEVLLPDGNATGLIEQLRRTDDDVRILAISGGGSNAKSVTCLELALNAGAHGVLLKPFTEVQCEEAVRHILRLPRTTSPGADRSEANSIPMPGRAVEAEEK